MEDSNLVIDYYKHYEEDKRLHKDKSHHIEFLTTLHYLNTFIT